MKTTDPRAAKTIWQSKLVPAGTATAVAIGMFAAPTIVNAAQSNPQIKLSQKRALQAMAKRDQPATITVSKLTGNRSLQRIRVDLSRPANVKLKLKTGNKYRVRLDVIGAADLVQVATIPKHSKRAQTQAFATSRGVFDSITTAITQSISTTLTGSSSSITNIIGSNPLLSLVFAPVNSLISSTLSTLTGSLNSQVLAAINTATSGGTKSLTLTEIQALKNQVSALITNSITGTVSGLQTSLGTIPLVGPLLSTIMSPITSTLNTAATTLIGAINSFIDQLPKLVAIGDVSTAPKIAALPQAFDLGFVQISPWDSYLVSDLSLPQVDQWKLLGAMFDQAQIPGLITDAVGASLPGLFTGSITNITTVLQYRVNGAANWSDAPLFPWLNRATVMKHGFGLFQEDYRKRQILGAATSPVTSRWVLSIPIIGIGTLTNLVGS